MTFCNTPSLSALLLAWLFALRGSALCECGYSVNSTSTANYQVFTEAWETDFLHLASITEAVGWQTQVYNVTAAEARGPDGKMADLANVIPNPLTNSDSWSGNALHGGDPGLQLFVRSALNHSMVPISEVDSMRTDMLYGSFRIGVKHSSVSGTCGAFFWFHNDTQEIDMEMLSRQFNSSNSTANLVVQTPASAAAGYNAAGTADYDTPGLPFNPSAAYHEYRFDWMPGRVNFYVDGKLYDTMTDEIPNSPGKVVLNHWSNGDPNWSGGPPASDAVMTIMYVKAYFNSTDTHPDYAKACAKYDASKVCQIPDQTSPPVLGNDSPTYFFFAQGNETNGQITSNSTWNSHGQHNAASTSFGSASILMTTVFAACSIWFLGFLS